MKSPFIIVACLAALFIFPLSAPRAQNVAADSEAAKIGAALYSDLRCGACHTSAASGINVPPALANAGDKFQSAWLATYLKSPYRRRWESAGVRPTLRMPNFLLSANEAQALAAFLATKRDSTRSKKLSIEFQQNDSTRVAEGKQIFQEYACYGCHQVNGKGGEVGPDLSGVGSRLQPEYLAAFLQNPQAFIPGSSMKISGLWEEEVQALVAYLMSLK